MGTELVIAGVGGTLRQGSYSGFLLKNSSRLMPAGSRLEVIDLTGIPLFNQDRVGIPDGTVKKFKDDIAVADGVLFVTPEYNYSIPGVLKNAIDVASFPAQDSPFRGKPAGIMSSSTGIFGGMRAQYHLRQVLVYLQMHVMPAPEFFLDRANSKFDDKGNLTDEESKKRISKFLVLFTEYVRKFTVTEPKHSQ